MFTDIIQYAYRYPAHRGEISDPTHAAEDENPLCGDELSIQLRVEDGAIREAAFEGRGCVISQAAAELLLERVTDLPATDVDSLSQVEVLEEMGLPSISPARLKCALLSLEVLRQALRRDTDRSATGLPRASGD